MELVGKLFAISVIVAVLTGIIIQLAKPIIFKRVNDKDTRAIVINILSVILAFLMTLTVTFYEGWSNEPAAIAMLIMRTFFGAGLATLGYEGVNNIVKKVTPPVVNDIPEDAEA